MKKLKILVLIALAAAVSCGFVGESRSKELAKKVFGRIKIVRSGADYRVKPVDSGGDLSVCLVESFPDKPGKWKIVRKDDPCDFKIKYVDSGADFTVDFRKSMR